MLATTAEAEVRRVRITGLHPGQLEVVQSPARFRVLCAGRRWGKSRVAAIVALRTALQGGRVWWVAPTAKLAAIGWRDIRRMAGKVPGVNVRLGDKRLTFPGDGTIEVRTAGEPGGLRGEGLDGLIYDEAAMGRDDSWSEELRPALADRKGWALFVSTPKGRGNWFYDLWLRGQAGDDPAWQSWQFPSAGNPHLDPVEVEAAREMMPAAAFDQEFLAEFNDAGASPFRPEDIEAMRVGWHGLKPAAGNRKYVTAWDIGRRGDPTVGGTIDVTAVPYQVVAFAREHRMPYPAQQAMIEARSREYPAPARDTHVESNGIGDPVIENLNVRVTPFVTTARSKTQALAALAMLLERGAIKCDIPEVVREMHAYQWDDGELVQDCVMMLAIAALHCPPVDRPTPRADSEDFKRRNRSITGGYQSVEL